MTSYDRLRSIGVSVETADALAPVVDSLSPKKREAFFLWAMGYNRREICKQLHISSKTLWKLIIYIKMETTCI
jgi:DNA-directed RNA polymerase specialized sigma24 family protein